MFKFNSLFSLLFITLLVTILSCSDNSNNTNTSDCPKVTAKVTDGITLDFSSCQAVYTKLVTSEFTQRNMTSTMTSGDKTYILIVSIYDKGSGKGTYKLNVMEGQISFSISGDANNIYNVNPEGEITLTEVTDNNWIGSFHAEMTCISSQTKVKINTGKINIK